MIVTLLENKRIISLRLPKKKNGTYWIRDWQTDDKLFSVEAIHGEWLAKSTSDMWFVDEKNEYINEVSFHPFNLYSVLSKDTGRFEHIIVEPENDFTRYRICSTKDIHIGRSEENEICLKNITISSLHARLSWKDNGWLLFDEDSANGVYVNNLCVSGWCSLRPGDMVYIMGFRLIIGKGFIAINNPNQMVTLNRNVLVPFSAGQLERLKEKRVTVPEYYVPDETVSGKDNYYSIEQCKDIIANSKSCLWERNWKKEDSLKLNIGLNCSVDVKKYSVVAVNGNRKDIIAFCKGLLLQLITLYSYSDLKIILLLDEKAEREFKTTRWLPHLWDNGKQQSYFVKSAYEVDCLSEYLKKRHNKLSKCRKTDVPYYIIMGFNRDLEKRLDMSGNRACVNVSRISFGYGQAIESLEPDILLDINPSIGNIMHANESDRQEFIPNIYVRENIDLLYLQLANTYMDLGAKYNKCIETVMVELYVAILEKSYDIRIPRNLRIGEILPVIEKQIIRQTEDYILSQGEGILCDREDGIVLDIGCTPEESGILNGTRLMLI